MKKHLVLGTTLLLSLWHPIQGMANDAEEGLLMSFGEEEFLSIATGQKQLVSKAPAVASVITAEEIRALGANTLEEVLATVPGMHVSLSAAYLSPIYSIRGIYTDKNPQVLMLVNGVPITQTHFGDRGGQAGFPVRSIARVEVIRGPGSAIYGADALAGVINVITKSAQQIGGTEIGVRKASFDTSEGWLLHGSRWGEVDVVFSLQATKTDGDDSRRIRSDAQSIFDQAAPPGLPPASRAPGPLSTRGEGYDARIDLKYDKFQLRAWNWHHWDGGVGPGLAMALDPKGRGEIDNYLLDAHYIDPELLANSVLEFHLSYMDINVRTRQTLFPAGAVLPIGDDGNVNPVDFTPMLFPEGLRGNPEFYEEHSRAELILNYDGLARHKLRFAAGFTQQKESGKESKNFGPGVLDLANRHCSPVFGCIVDGTLTRVDGTPYLFIEKQKRNITFFSIQDQWRLANDWNLTWGLRYDNYSDFGSTTNPRIALVWEATTDLTAKFLAGRAFRAPSFAEQFLINNPVALGNPRLDPETASTYELAFDYRANFDLRFGFNVYHYKIRDLIDFVSQGSVKIAANVGEQVAKGFELETEWKPTSNLRFIANYSLQDARDERLGVDAARSPERQAYLRATWIPAPDWSVTGDMKWIANRKRQAYDPRKDIDDYTITNLNIERQRILGHFDLGLRVRNLFDEKAYEPSPFEAVPQGSLIPDDFPLEERSVHLTARWHF